MSTEENKALIRRSFEEIFSKGNYDVADEIYEKDMVGHVPPNELKGPEGIKQFASLQRNAFPDFQITVQDQIAEGDRVASRWTATGTHKGEFQGIAPTGKKVNITATTIVRISNGKIVEGWSNMDALGMMVQLGVIPPPKK